MKLDIRNAANSLRIEGKGGCYLGTQPIGGVERRRTGPFVHIIYTYMSYIHIIHTWSMKAEKM